MIYVHTTQRLHFLFVYKAVVIHVLLLYNFLSFFLLLQVLQSAKEQIKWSILK